jgi:hypothetical protein
LELLNALIPIRTVLAEAAEKRIASPCRHPEFVLPDTQGRIAPVYSSAAVKKAKTEAAEETGIMEMSSIFPQPSNVLKAIKTAESSSVEAVRI